MNTNTSTNSFVRNICHPSYHGFLRNSIDGLDDFFRAVATHAIGHSIVLAATGAKETKIVMPGLQDIPHCVADLSSSSWVINGDWLSRMTEHPEPYLANIAYQVGGPTANVVLGDGDYYGELGIAEIDEALEYCSDFSRAHDVPVHHVLGASTFVAEGILGRYSRLAGVMIERLLKNRSLNQQDMQGFLANVRVENVGMQVHAALFAPWIDDVSERVHRMFVGS